MLAPLPRHANRDPVVAAWGMGLDSTAMLIELVAQGDAPDVVLTADTGAERDETYAFLPIFQRWMDDHGLEHHVVRYAPKRFKHWPPYASILENVLTNATLPSISMGRGSCSLKWKVEPQDRWVRAWEPAKAAWAAGRTVTKLIGYDAGAADTRRSQHAGKRPVTSVGRGSSRPAVCLITAAGKGATISTRGAASGRSGDCAAHVQS